jgi:hypothetical protein
VCTPGKLGDVGIKSGRLSTGRSSTQEGEQGDNSQQGLHK